MSGKIQFKTVSELLKEAAKTLKPHKITCEADQKLGWLEAEILMAHAIKKERSWIVAHSNDSLSPVIEKQFQALVQQRLTHEPIAYIIGAKDFYGRPFFVNKSTLIPRPDTEIIIDELKKQFSANDSFALLDLGTGSGAIAITIALEFPNADIIASDICKRALKVAEKNAKLYSVEHRIKFVQASLLGSSVQQKIKLINEKYPFIIAANLPYLPESDKQKLAKDVTEFEPEKALYSGKDGLDLIRLFFKQVSENILVNPHLILAEFDAPQAKIILKLAQDAFPIAKCTIIKDLSKRDRLLRIQI